MRSSEQLDFLAIEMGGGITVRDLEAFLAPLERTRGLVDLVTGDHASAGLLSAIYRTYSDSFHAVPCAQNAAHLQDFCLAVMQVLETVGALPICVWKCRPVASAVLEFEFQFESSLCGFLKQFEPSLCGYLKRTISRAMASLDATDHT